MLNNARTVARVAKEVVVVDVGPLGANFVPVEAANFREKEVGGGHSDSVDGGRVALQGVAGNERFDVFLGCPHSVCEGEHFRSVGFRPVGEIT